MRQDDEMELTTEDRLEVLEQQVVTLTNQVVELSENQVQILEQMVKLTEVLNREGFIRAIRKN